MASSSSVNETSQAKYSFDSARKRVREREMPMTTYDNVTSIYHLFLEKNWIGLKRFYEEQNLEVFMPLNSYKDTALHLAVYSEDRDLVKYVVEIWYKWCTNEDYPFDKFDKAPPNAVGNTPLHEAASIGIVKLVKLILKHDDMTDIDRELLKIENQNGETPVFMAALYGKTNVLKYFACENKLNIGDHFLSNTSTMLHEAIRGYYFETALELLKPKYGIPKNWEDSNGMTCFQLLADIPFAFKSGYSFDILEKLVYQCISVPEDQPCENNKVAHVDPSRKTGLLPSVRDLRDMKKQHRIVVEITKILANDDQSWQQADGARPTDYSTDVPVLKRNNSTSDVQGDTPPPIAAANVQGDTPPPIAAVNVQGDTPPPIAAANVQGDTPLIAAAKNGITEIIEAILDEFPQAIDHHNHTKKNVFHVAVQNRRKNVLDFLKSKGFQYPKLIQKFDEDGDGILHKAAYKSDFSSTYRPGEALCLQSDIQWFEQVRKWAPKHHFNQKNYKELTPQSLFTKEHKDMVKKGEEWLIRTTNSCIIVAVLIATVAFTSIYTVPGGSDPKGKPRLLNTTAFTVFTVSDVASLCFAFTSVVVFLSIITSRMKEQDFLMTLPLKLVLGLSMLFFSVAALMIGFAATLVMTMRHSLHQAAAPIIAIACFPVAFFLLLQLPLYFNITWFTMKDLVRSLIHIIPLGKCQPRSIMDQPTKSS